MKHKREIVESKYPPRNNEDIWLKDLLLYASTTKGWLPLGSEKTYSSKEELLADKPAGGTIGIDKETGTAYLYNDVSKEWTPVGDVGEDITLVTWQELKDKRDNKQLIPGALYRITDYQCTTIQENTRSAGHQFDIVLLALSEDKLAEEGWAMMHEDIYDVICTDNVIVKCYYYAYYGEHKEERVNLVNVDTLLGYSGIQREYEGIINHETKTITFPIDSATVLSGLSEENLTYNYFQNSNLSAWKVWYCLDNDKSRFAWADDSVDEDIPASIIYTEIGKGGVDIHILIRKSSEDEENLYAWGEEGAIPLYTLSLTPSVGDTIYYGDGRDTGNTVNSFTPAHEGTGLPSGRGVIYRLIDEFNNDIKYDFKNIQFKRKITNGQYDATNGTDTWCYTLNIWYNDMCQDASIVGNTLPNDEGFITGVYDNNIGYVTAYELYIEDVNTFVFALGDNVVLSFDNGGYFGIYSNTIGNCFYNNTIGNMFFCNTILNGFYNNMIGDSFSSNMIGNDVYGNIIGNGFGYNIIGNGCTNNTIGNNVTNNTIGNHFDSKTISDNTSDKNYGNNGVELATKDDIGDIETALNNI